MLPFLGGTFGNPSSAHAFGRRRPRGARRRARAARRGRSARDAREIVFTSGGTEADNLALKGAAWAGKARGHRIVTTPVEHHAVGHALDHLQKFGFEVVEVPVDRYGRVDPADVERAITDRTILVTVMLANNEVGTIQPVAEVAAVVRARRGRRCSTSTPSRRRRGSTSTSTRSARTSSRSRPTRPRARRAPGRCGSGAGTHILAQQHGGSQERYRRAGTENVAGAVGMATAFELARRRARDARPAGPCPARPAAGGAVGRRRRRADRPSRRAAPAHRLGRSSAGDRRRRRSRSRSTSRASPRRPAPPAPAARPRSATS